jgi:hypothetical protein
MTGKISPAQAILDAQTDALSDFGNFGPNYEARGLAAAIRSLVGQAGSTKHWHIDQLNAIAAELEALPND